MTTATTPSNDGMTGMRPADTRTTGRRGLSRGEETKPAWKTTELYVYLAAVVAVLIASNAVGSSGGSGGDVFTADKAWWFITLLTIGYLVSRGLSKVGVRTPDEDPRTH
ncbi:hypothetical protein ACFFWC_08010 [Plantactinospora siamensis]|uniref:Uncharacterized protein n=1 Tax=Plantactinospora siamensis TaxID=555372 RepID=A0ABV6P585_9ACTN